MKSVTRREAEPVSITNAPIAHSRELKGREVRYLLSMLVRTFCFVAAVVSSGPLRWIFIAAAIFLPYIAVVLANAGNRRAPLNTAFTPEPFGVLESESATRAPAGPSPVPHGPTAGQGG